MVAPDNDSANLNTYSGYDDPTGKGSPVGPPSEGESVGTRHISQAAYDELVANGEVQGNVVYVTTGESAE